MENLKTLKDVGEHFAVLKKDLKQEAIKWLKDIDNPLRDKFVKSKLGLFEMTYSHIINDGVS